MKDKTKDKYDPPIAFRLRPKDHERLNVLAERWETTKTDVIRRLLRQAYESLGKGSER